MRIGFSFHQGKRAAKADLGAIRTLVQAAESLGYDHLRTAEHVLGANSASRPGWTGPYDHTQFWHEPFVLFGYLASITERLEFATSVLILPQRQTALVAKQAAEVDVLSVGRLRLGIGIGWNDVEYEALGEDFTNRGPRSEEQIHVMRSLWTQESVTFDGKWHRITDAGLNPLPVQRPIPVWIGGGPGAAGSRSPVQSERVLKRVARIADGWIPSLGLDTGVGEAAERLRGYMRENGRDTSELGIEGLVSIGDTTPDVWVRQVQAWRDVGATHLAISTGDLASVDGRIEMMSRFKEAVSEVAD